LLAPFGSGVFGQEQEEEPLPTLEDELLKEDPAELAKAARQQGEAARGAILFYQEHLTCRKCHTFEEEDSPLGPNLTKPDPEQTITDTFLVQSLLDPSKDIRKGFESVVVYTDDGLSITGLLVSEDDDKLVLRDPNDDGKEVSIDMDTVEDWAESTQSIMPPELVNQLADRQQFLDLLRYVIEIIEGGPRRALELEPEPSLYARPPLPEYEKHVDHAGMIADLDQESFKRGEAIYNRLCVNCHGTHEEPGSLPTSLRFATDKFRNGSGPHAMYKTLTNGFGLMVPQTWMVPKQKYDVVHYIREAYLKEDNASQYVDADETYLAKLPEGDTRGPEPVKYEPWVAMDYGPNLTASYEIGTNASNFAYKGMAIRLDPGAGGVTRGRYWVIYDEDTLRVAAGWSGEEFIDYNAIMLNGRHAIHPRLVGQVHFENKTGPGWANPEDGSFEDPRFLGRDDRPYGPLPRDWAHYKGMYHQGNRVIVSYTVGDTAVLEMPAVDASTDEAIFTRTMNIGPRSREMILQVAEQRGADVGLLSLDDVASEADAADGRITVFGPGGALVVEEPDPTEDPATPGDLPPATPLSFDGKTRVEIAKAGKLNMSLADYTICARIRTKQDGTILAKTAAGGNWPRGGQSLFVRSGKLAFDIGFVGVVGGRTAVNDNRWHEVAMIYEHATNRIRLFVDGKLDGERNMKPLGGDQAFVVRLGYTCPNFPQKPFYSGQMSHVAFYGRALSDAEIAKATAESGPNDGLVARWQADRAHGTTVVDVTKHGHDGQVLKGRPKGAPAAPASAVGGVMVAGISQPIEGAQWLATEDGQLRLKIPAGKKPLKFTLSLARVEKVAQVAPTVERLAGNTSAMDLSPLTRGGPPRWPGELVMQDTVGSDDGPFAIDVLTRPANNPWLCRVRPTGFDFMPDGKRAVVACWDGDVWMVSGLDRPGEKITWQRIASGLFQPLGLKFLDGKIYVGCRDQIAILHDLNGDGEIDYYENFNNDHQVTEHFHEFAMGLQTDPEGNFYYAKSARHAKAALVPHHGTLLRVSKDGSRTDILATGFRAANGVCINPDGTFFVTDQEGHWMPKNRINWVPGKGGYYGNAFGYHDVTDTSDEAMRQPLCWITNSFDRSPAELMWVTSDKWGPLKGTLLNTSYGYGMVYVVPHERIDGQAQGGMCRLPIPAFPTGVMRGRFHPGDGQLYLCGMFSWAGSRTQPGGFYRMRYTGKPVHLPLDLAAKRTSMQITFSGPLDREIAEKAENYSVKIWALRRSANYGSPHVNERSLPVTKAALQPDGQTVVLTIPDLEPTWGMEIRYRLKGAGGEPVDSMIHNSIFRFGE